jgi:transcriptional antiterminator RfaH
MFIQTEIETVGLSTFQWMPFAMGLVCFGDEPAIVPENLVHTIRKRVEEITAAGGELFEGLQPGDKIVIRDGPFAGYEAIFDARVPGSERVRVLLQLLNSQRQVPMELDSSYIQRVKKKK